eukprot:5347247-Karenia_brevis.AAC.1
MTGWKPIDVQEYNDMLDTKVADIMWALDAEEKSNMVQHCMRTLETNIAETALLCQRVENVVGTSRKLNNETLQLINQRRELKGQSHQRQRGDLSRLIQKQIRAQVRQRRRSLINEKVESFKDSKSIAGIKS